MDRVQGGREPPVEGTDPSSSPAEAPEPPNVSNPRTKLADAGANSATAEQYPSYIRRKTTGVSGEDDDEERDTEKGYVGGDRVRLLVGR